MLMKYPYLKDKKFLDLIDKQTFANKYIRIVLLDWNENPIQEIQGDVVSGGCSLDGDSAQRRVVNFSINIKNNDITNITNPNNLFSINKKFYLELGTSNKTNYYQEYPIVWNPQGIFIITSCNLSTNSSGTTLNIEGRDKMCLLDGTCGGKLGATTQFDSYDYIDVNGNIMIKKPTISQIIKELVNHFGGEQLGKILISDLDERIKQVMRWTGDSPLYLVKDGTNYFMTTLFPVAELYEYSETFVYGDNVGYVYSDFVYTQELIGSADNSICDILDNIVSYLGNNYEYFYDVYGNFIFQEKKNYFNKTKATEVIENLNKNIYLTDTSIGKSVYNFNDSTSIISYSNNPDYSNIKNDYVVWGVRETAEGLKLPIRYHLAIDTKPKTGNFYKVCFFIDSEDNLEKAKKPIEFSSYSELIKNPGDVENLYYTLDTKKIYRWDEEAYKETDYELIRIKTNDWRSELYLQGVYAEALGLAQNYYYKELKSEWTKIYNLKAKKHSDNEGSYYTGEFYEEILNNPTGMDFFLDFIDSYAAVSILSVNNIGRRTLVEESDDFNCILEPEIHDFILIEAGQKDTQEKRAECERRNQPFLQVDSWIFNLLATGGIYNSCFWEIKNMLYNYTGYNENIQIETLPISQLEPNTRISITNRESDIYGDYIIKSISIPFEAGGTMSISAMRAIEKI